jgi:hypothetical protein
MSPPEKIIMNRAAGWRRWAGGVVLAGFILPVSSWAVVKAGGIQMVEGSPYRIDIDLMYNQLPLFGYLPVRVTLANSSARERSWDLAFLSRSSHEGRQAVNYEVTLRVPAQSERTTELMIPLACAFSRQRYPVLIIQANGPGLGGRTFQHSTYIPYGAKGTSSFVGFTTTLQSWRSALADALQKDKKALVHCDVAPADLPSDYRGYLCFDGFWMAAGDWRSLSAAQRGALLDWVRVGGNLMVETTRGNETILDEMGVPGAGADPRPFGFGTARVVVWDGKTAPVNFLKTETNPRDDRLLESMSGGYGAAWMLRDGMRPLLLRAGLILGFIGGFAFVVGPLNLFWAARRQRHYQLLWTTPVISLLASVLLVVVIMLQDGAGGTGRRFALTWLDSSSNRQVTWQEQVARTGVLLNRRFPADEDLVMLPLNVDSSLDSRRSSYSIAPRDRDGDWFTSRAVLGHLLVQAMPTRARIEVWESTEPAAPPRAVSSLGRPVKELYYVDTGGNFWKAGPVNVGERIHLEPATADQFNRWWALATQPLGRHGRRLLANAAPRPGHFFAMSEGAGLETLAGLDWERQTVACFGAAQVMMEGRTP